MSLYFICPYILYLFRIQKGMFHELGFFLGGVGGTQPKTNKVHAGVKKQHCMSPYTQNYVHAA